MLNNKNFQKVYSLLALIGVLGLTFIAIWFSLDRYNSFVYGKFDLGNMNQMLYNSTRGDFMVITDYFGQNVPRWAMSHVDPSLLIFVPFNIFFSDASFLLFAQTFSFTLSSVLIYLIAKKEGLNNILSSNIGVLLMLLPISGYILVWTTFHSLILAMPFLLIGYLLSFNLNKSKKISKVALFGFYLSFILAILSKEEIGFVVFAFCLYLYFKFKNIKKHIIAIGLISVIWSFVCFLVIIPSYANLRTEGINNFINYLGGVDDDSFLNFSGENYFLYRYSEFGSSYSEIAKNLFLKPSLTFNLVFSPENLSTLNKLLLPHLYLVFLSPLVLIATLPEVAIQILTGDPSVFSIENHRLLILIPLMLIALINAFVYISKYSKTFALGLSFILLILNIFLAHLYKNPLIYPFSAKVINKVFASQEANEKYEFYNNIRPECGQFMVDYAKPYNKVSVPQPVGAKTSNKHFNALFPAGLEEADLIITDVYARKLVDFLDISVKYNKIAVQKALINNFYKLTYSCDRFFALSKANTNTNLGSVQILNDYNSADTLDTPTLLKESKFYKLDFSKSNEGVYNFNYTYKIGDENDRKSLFAYTILVAKESGEVITFMHFPTYYLTPLNDVPVNSVLKEDVVYTLPNIYSHLVGKEVDVYFGIGNRENNEENIYVKTIKL